MTQTYIRSTTKEDRLVAKRIPHAHWEAFMLPGGEVFIDKRRGLKSDGRKAQRIKGGMLTPHMRAGKQCVSACYHGRTEGVDVESIHAQLFPDVTFKSMDQRMPCQENRAGFVLPSIVSMVKPSKPVVVAVSTPTKRMEPTYAGLHAEMQGVASVHPKGIGRVKRAELQDA